MLGVVWTCAGVSDHDAQPIRTNARRGAGGHSVMGEAGRVLAPATLMPVCPALSLYPPTGSPSWCKACPTCQWLLLVKASGRPRPVRGVRVNFGGAEDAKEVPRWQGDYQWGSRLPAWGGCGRGPRDLAADIPQKATWPQLAATAADRGRTSFVTRVAPALHPGPAQLLPDSALPPGAQWATGSVGPMP